MSRVAVLTGAARGIGAATAALLRERGWRVVGIDCDWPEGPPDGSVALDVSDEAALRGAIGGLERLDVLVNNAAIMGDAPLEALAANALRQTFEVNLVAAALAISASVPALAASGGAVVNVASVHAAASREGMAAYAAAKGGLLALTRAAAVELGPRGVRVNAVVPGATDTAMLSPRSAGQAREESLAALAAKTPLRRVGSPREPAEAIAFLADGERSGFITGASLVVDGGALARLSTE